MVDAISLQPSSAILWLDIGRILSKQGSTELALDSYMTAARIDPLSPVPHELSAGILLSLPQPSHPPPLVPLLLALSRGTRCPTTLFALGNALTREGVMPKFYIRPYASGGRDGKEREEGGGRERLGEGEGREGVGSVGEDSVHITAASAVQILRYHNEVVLGERAGSEVGVHITAAACHLAAATLNPTYMEAYNNAGSSLISAVSVHADRPDTLCVRVRLPWCWLPRGMVESKVAEKPNYNRCSPPNLNRYSPPNYNRYSPPRAGQCLPTGWGRINACLQACSLLPGKSLGLGPCARHTTPSCRQTCPEDS